MELELAGRFADNLLVNPDGNLTLVECKLWRNPEARRSVIAQGSVPGQSLYELTKSTLQQDARARAARGVRDGRRRRHRSFRPASHHERVARHRRAARWHGPHPRGGAGRGSSPELERGRVLSTRWIACTRMPRSA
ncbi:MAG: hypothetical protein DCC71_00310 [Proteobacteria bacterium]|nr:MAG: hypothetical protein DCC71_00310 [Pseudomonadota bacterium]